jgi:hypothetical protein
MDERTTSGGHHEPDDRGLEARLAWAVMLLTIAVGSLLMVGH